MSRVSLTSLIAAVVVSSACSSSEVPQPGPSDTEMDVAAEVDAGGLFEAAVCSPSEQVGCEQGEKCTLVKSGGEKELGCSIDDGSRELGEVCDPNAGVGDNCQAGLYCDTSAEPPLCVEFCQQEPMDTCSEGTACSLGFLVDDSEIRLCADRCDPIDQDCARDGFGCYPSRSGPTCAVVGAGGATVGEGESCSYSNECEPGLGCFRVGADATWSCFSICDPFGGGASCSAEQLCNQVEDESWGLCIDE